LKERPILFSGPMVKAILEGRKTQTRRVIKPQPGDVKFYAPAGQWGERENDWMFSRKALPDGENTTGIELINCLYGKPGDRLWVRETLRRDPNGNVWYYAAGKPEDWVTVKPENHTASLVWAVHKEGDICVSIHMPRWASRITLEITSVRVGRIMDISEADARDEGAGISLHEFPQWDGDPNCYRKLFRERWNSLNGKRGFGWEKNPWVWVVEFKRLEESHG
jgi:hypothetical protein